MDRFEQIYSELRGTKDDIIIYGAGGLAAVAARQLEKNGIDFLGFAIDSAYFRGGTYLGKPLIDLQKYTESNKCVLVIGFFNGFTEEKERELSACPNIKKIFAADYTGRFSLGGDCKFTDKFLNEHREEFAALRKAISDEVSADHLEAFIQQRIEGNFRKLHSDKPQYFDDEVISFGKNEVFADCGAFDGDTIQTFVKTLKECGSYPYKKIFAFEADSKNADKMRENLKSLDNIEIICKGVSDKSGTLYFDSKNSTSSAVSDHGIAIPVVSIDEAVGDENVTFIKMDIEGSELKALAGAEKTVRRCRPKLAVCVYHKLEDLVTIPQYILKLDPGYRLYFRNYLDAGHESVIYAI